MINEKPKSMSLSNFFIKKTAIKTLIPESIVELVVKDQWKQLNEAIKSNKHCEHEVSGFAYFNVAPVKLGSNLDKYSKMLNALQHKKTNLENQELPDRARVTEIRAAAVEKVIENLIEKKNSYESRLERTVKWNSEPIYRSAMDKRNSEREARDLQELP